MTPLFHLIVVLLVFALGRNVVRYLALVVVDTLEYLWLCFMPKKWRQAQLRTVMTHLRRLRHDLSAELQ